MAELYAARQMFAEALPSAEKAFACASWNPPSVGIFAGVLSRMGEQDRANDVIRSLGAGQAYGASTGLALFHLCRGELDLAADWFEKAIEERYTMAPPTLQSPIAEPLRASPRWPKMARMMNLTGAG